MKKNLAHLINLLPTLLFVGAFYPGLFVGFTLVDDSTLNRVVVRWFASDGAWSDLLYNTAVQGGARYTPMFWIVKATILGVFGYNAVMYHAVHLFFSWVPLCGVPLYFAYRYKKWAVAFLPFLFFLIYSGTGWGSQLWNLYDVSTYDPLAVFFLSLVLFLLDLYALEKKVFRKNIILLLVFLCMLGSAHSKEAYGLALLASALLFLLFWLIFRNPLYKLISISAILSSTFFFLGYWYSGALALRSVNDYTSTYSLNSNIIIANTWFIFKSYLLHGAYLLPAVVSLSYLQFSTSSMREKSLLISPLCSYTITLPLFAIVLILHGIQLPVEFLPDQPRLYYAGVISLAYISTLAFLPVLSPKQQLLPQWVSTNVVCLFVLLSGVFIPFRVMTFNSIYTSSIGKEWEAVLHARNILKEYPEIVINVYSPESESFYWGMFIHLENMGITPNLEMKHPEDSTIILQKKSFLLLRNPQLYTTYNILDDENIKLEPLETLGFVWSFTDIKYVLNLLRSGKREPFRSKIYSTITWR
jgi:hypothetical protein